MQRASMLNEIDLRRIFSNKDEKHRMSQDSEVAALKFYGKNNKRQATLPRPRYKATAKIKPKKEVRSDKSADQSSALKQVKLYKIPWRKVIEAHKKIE